MARASVAGGALAVGAAGSVLLLAGMRNADVQATLRAILRGQAPPSGPSLIPASAIDTPAGSTSGENTAGAGWGAATGREAVKSIKKYMGIKYVFGAHDPSKGFDCSGLITWVLHHDLGIDLPNNTHTVTSQFYVWSGAKTVPRDQAQPGDLVCWASHIGMVSVGPYHHPPQTPTKGRMIHAPHTGDVVREREIYWTPEPLIRRPLAYGGA